MLRSWPSALPSLRVVVEKSESPHRRRGHRISGRQNTRLNVVQLQRRDLDPASMPLGEMLTFTCLTLKGED